MRDVVLLRIDLVRHYAGGLLIFNCSSPKATFLVKTTNLPEFYKNKYCLVGFDFAKKVYYDEYECPQSEYLINPQFLKLCHKNDFKEAERLSAIGREANKPLWHSGRGGYKIEYAEDAIQYPNTQQLHLWEHAK